MVPWPSVNRENLCDDCIADGHSSQSKVELNKVLVVALHIPFRTAALLNLPADEGRGVLNERVTQGLS